MEGRKDGRKEGSKERTEGRKEGWKEGRNKRSEEGRKEAKVERNIGRLKKAHMIHLINALIDSMYGMLSACKRELKDLSRHQVHFK